MQTTAANARGRGGVAGYRSSRTAEPDVRSPHSPHGGGSSAVAALRDDFVQQQGIAKEAAPRRTGTSRSFTAAGAAVAASGGSGGGGGSRSDWRSTPAAAASAATATAGGSSSSSLVPGTLVEQAALSSAAASTVSAPGSQTAMTGAFSNTPSGVVPRGRASIAPRLSTGGMRRPPLNPGAHGTAAPPPAAETEVQQISERRAGTRSSGGAGPRRQSAQQQQQQQHPPLSVRSVNGGGGGGGTSRAGDASAANADAEEVLATLSAASLRAAQEARETRQEARVMRQAQRQTDMMGMEDAMLAAALSISMAEDEDQRQVDAIMALSRGAPPMNDNAVGGMPDFFPGMFGGGDGPSDLFACMLFGGAAMSPFPQYALQPSQDEEALLAQAQRESLLEAWRASLPVSLHDAQRGGCQDNSECSLCLADFNQGDRIMHLDCLHFFHEDCIAPWIATRSSCPLCKVDFLENLS